MHEALLATAAQQQYLDSALCLGLYFSAHLGQCLKVGGSQVFKSLARPGLQQSCGAHQSATVLFLTVHAQPARAIARDDLYVVGAVGLKFHGSSF